MISGRGRETILVILVVFVPTPYALFRLLALCGQFVCDGFGEI